MKRDAASDHDAALRSAIVAGEIRPGMTFSQRVWAVTSRIPAGRVATYGDVARALGSRGPRAVGQALHRNPYAPQVPCHRVVGANGALTGFGGGLARKRAMLLAEGVRFVGDRVDPACSCSLS